MRRVIVESPFSGDTERNLRYARAALLDSLRRGEAPFASHLLYPYVLNDSEPPERSLGIAAGLVWGEVADATVVYYDLGVSKGMAEGIGAAARLGRSVEMRTLPNWAGDRAGDGGGAGEERSV